jgi:hypothetical protein
MLQETINFSVENNQNKLSSIIQKETSLLADSLGPISGRSKSARRYNPK